MLTEIYIEALLANEELADQVWETWDKGEIDDQVAWLAKRDIDGLSMKAQTSSCLNNAVVFYAGWL